MVSSKQNRSIMVSEVEVPPDVPDKSSIPRSLLSPTLKLAFNRRSVSSPTEDDALEPKQDHDQRQDQMQEQLILLASINEQTTSLLQTLSQFQSQSQSQRQYQPKSEDRENEVFEQALILGQIVLVLASSLSHTVEGQAQVLVALANMGMTLVKQSDRTGNKRDLEEAGGLFERAVVVGKGGNAKKERKLGKHEDVDGSGEVLVRLEKLGGLLGERGVFAWSGVVDAPKLADRRKECRRAGVKPGEGGYRDDWPSTPSYLPLTRVLQSVPEADPLGVGWHNGCNQRVGITLNQKELIGKTRPRRIGRLVEAQYIPDK